MRRHKILWVVALSLSLGGCAAFSQWQNENPEQAQSLEDAVDATAAAGAGLATATGFGLIAPFILAGGVVVRNILRKNKEEGGSQ